MLRYSLAIIFGAILTGCSPPSKIEECDYSHWNAIEVKPDHALADHPFYDPKTHRAPKPVYPEEARARRASGIVNVRALIDHNGKALKTCAVILPGEPEAHKSLIDAALANVKQWHFRPLEGGSQTLRQTTAQVKFELATR